MENGVKEGEMGGGRKESREIAAVRKLLFKIGIPLRLVGTRNADRRRRRDENGESG